MFKPVEQNPNFPELEKKLLDNWYKNGVVDKYLHKNNRSKKYFSFIDGPITANNPMGVHHAWGRTYKDLWRKFFNLLGYQQKFQNGFDCQGLWVEVEVEKELKLKSKKDIENLIRASRKASIAKFVQLCKDRVVKYSGIQTEQSKRLGYFADWENSYFTMSDENNYMIWLFLKKCFDNGWIYKGHESVPWCPRCQTAISQHEMLTEDYKEVVHESIIFELPIVGKKNEYLLVWTTTPWTIPANIAVAVDVKLDYCLVRGQTDDLFWVAKELVDSVFKGKHNGVIKTVKGKELVGLKYKGAFDYLPAVVEVAKNNPKNFHTVIPTDKNIMPISTTEGTGLVHTAVSAGTEDFKLGKKLGLPMIPVITDNADYLPGLGEFSGKNAKQHPRLILDYMEKENFVFEIHNYKHRYPACWRCKTELVWKVADEWYIAMDRPSKVGNGRDRSLRQRMIEVAKKIKWMPEFGLEREIDWLKNMHDWLISKKNRYWGLALPIYECHKCHQFTVIGSKEELKEKAVAGWKEFDGHSPHKPFIDEVKIKCPKCQEIISRIDDVGNPWLDAGIVTYSTISKDNKSKPLYLTDKEEWKKWAPADFITESFPGQFKNWFYALIVESTVLEDINPFKSVLGYGTLLGEDGRPMHKSWGNSIEFNEGADKIGVDVMRWMFARQNPSENMLFGYKKADEIRRQFYLMFWNIYRFFVEYSNLDKPVISNTARDPLNENKQNILDLWIIERLNWLIKSSQENYKKYDAQTVALESEKFVSDLSTWYIRRSRDRIWVNSKDQNDKNNFYKTVYYVLVNLSIILSPIIPFLTEIIYTNLTGEESVHLSSWPQLNSEFKIPSFVETSKGKQNSELFADMELVRKIVEVGHRVRKEKQLKVRQPLAKAIINLSASQKFNQKNYISSYIDLIKGELNVKKVEINKSKREDIEVEYNTELTNELIQEGKVRDLIRQIQELRKKQGKKPFDKINLTIPLEFKTFTDFIKMKVMADKVSFGDEIKL